MYININDNLPGWLTFDLRKEEGMCKCRKEHHILHEEMLKTTLKRDEEFEKENVFIFERITYYVICSECKKMYRIDVKYEGSKKDDFVSIEKIKQITPEYIIVNVKNNKEALYNMGYKDMLIEVFKFIDNEDKREIEYRITNNKYTL
ncbi:MAG: hypothetical protein ACRDD7_11540 [Peptostreptococcaceae bacterium]